MDEYADLDATALAELVRGGDVKPAELVEEAIGRTEQLNPALNAVIHRHTSGATRTAPLQRVRVAGPFLLKDTRRARG